MIQIVQNEDWELSLNGIDPSRKNIRRDKELYGKFIDIYEKNFNAWLRATKNKEEVEQLIEGQKRYGETTTVVKMGKLRAEFDKVRPYFYEYQGNYFLFRSTLIGTQEAVIVMLEPDDILATLEKNLSGFSILEKIKRKSHMVSYITVLE